MAATTVPAPFKVGKIEVPLLTKGKHIGDMGLRTDTLSVSVQVVAPREGETNLHSHPATDSTWVVLDGKAEFYGTEDDVFLAELDKNEAIMIPEGQAYWFKCSSDVPLVILHITARTKNYVPGQNTRINHRPAKEWYQDRSHSEVIEGAVWK